MWSGSAKSSSDEWIELRNLTGTSVDLSGWTITKNTGTETLMLTIDSGKAIPANGYFLISRYDRADTRSALDIDSDISNCSSVALSNSNLQIKLYDGPWNGGGSLIDTAGNGKEPLAGLNSDNLKASMERVMSPGDGTKSSDWYTATDSRNIKPVFNEKATPGFSNSLEPTISKIKDAKRQINEVKVTGIVTTLPGLFFDSRLYIQDETGGIRVKLKNGIWPLDIAAGTRLTVKGQIDTYYSEKELQIVDISEKEIGDKESIAPFVLRTGEMNLHEGDLVKVSGTISETSGDTFYVDDGSGVAKIYVKDESGIKLPTKHKGDKAEIIGIVNNWSGNFRILPRMQSDISITPKTTPEEVKNLPIKEAKKQPKGTKVRVRGVVSAPPGVLSKSYFYIQDDEAGIQIYCYRKDFPNLILGYFVEIVGEISESFGEKRIKITNAQDITVLEGRAPPQAKSIKAKDISNFEGILARVRGTVVKTSGNTFYIDDGTGEIKIVIQKLAGINKPRLHRSEERRVGKECRSRWSPYH